MTLEALAVEIGTITAGIVAILAAIKPILNSINRTGHRAELLLRIERFFREPSIKAFNEIEALVTWYVEVKHYNHAGEITNAFNELKRWHETNKEKGVY